MQTRLPHLLLVSTAIALLTLLTPGSGLAQITKIELVVVESPALNGQRFGHVGQYERLVGVAHGEVDPTDPRHAGIVNLEQAPRNKSGRVEYSTEVEIYRPIDISRGNGAIYHTVPNRGGAGPAETAILERGFSLVRVGWQGDIASTENNVVASLPVATRADGSAIVGPAVEEFIFNDAARRSRARLTYPAASSDQGDATLTVRRTQAAQRQTPPDLAWRYVDSREIEIDRTDAFDGGAIYELVYLARDPIVMGLGFAAMRDTVSFLRYNLTDDMGRQNPLAGAGLPEVAISFGQSQSGRFLRDFLYQGFNEDTVGRIVFDGLHPDIAGSRKTFTNYEFGQPGRWQKQHEDHLYPGDQFPFTYVTLTDPVSGRTDGLQERCRATNTCPKIIHSDGEAELWQARASLVVTDPIGQHIDLPDNVRVYLVAGTQHGGGRGVHATMPTAGICQNLNNPLDMRQIRLALSIALYLWVADGVEPPASRFPTVANHGLVSAAAAGFPDIPGVTYSGSYNPLYLRDHDTVPPTQGAPYTVLVAKVDTDGNMTHGIRHPNLSVPVGTHTGWNLRREGFGLGEQCRATGSFVPFVADVAERRSTGDPRLSLAERYSSHEAYVHAIAAAADNLVGQRLLLRPDADDIVELARGSVTSEQD